MNQVPPLPPFGHPLLRPKAEERDGERSVLLRFMEKGPWRPGGRPGEETTEFRETI